MIALWKPQQPDPPAKFRDRNRERIEWAREYLPDEHEGSVVVAMAMIEMAAGREAVTRNAVLARLESQGKLASQREAA